MCLKAKWQWKIQQATNGVYHIPETAGTAKRTCSVFKATAGKDGPTVISSSGSLKDNRKPNNGYVALRRQEKAESTGPKRTERMTPSHPWRIGQNWRGKWGLTER